MTVQEICVRLFDSSPGILAVGITAEVSQKIGLSPGEAFRYEPPVPWSSVFTDVFVLFERLDLYDPPLGRLRVSVRDKDVLVERQDGWFVGVVVVPGHPVRKSLRRMVSKAFRELKKLNEPSSVVVQLSWTADSSS